MSVLNDHQVNHSSSKSEGPVHYFMVDDCLPSCGENALTVLSPSTLKYMIPVQDVKDESPVNARRVQIYETQSLRRTHFDVYVFHT